ncbi:MAG: acyl carrier protein [Spirochaetales bacterium]|nr:acyl carrier protein [Spirochaetales bacterium]
MATSTFEKVKKIIVDKIEVDESQVTMEASLMQDLGADSLDTYELVFGIEEEFGITVPEDLAAEVQTVGDIVKFLEANL